MARALLYCAGVMRPNALLAFALLGAAACGESAPAVDAGPDVDGATGAPDSSAGADAGSQEVGFVPDRVGIVNLVVSEFAGPDTGSFAALRDGPELPGLELVAEEGDCAYWKRVEEGFCETPCSGFCSPEGTCVPWPANRSAGFIAVTGLRGALGFEPTASGYQTESSIEGDLFDPGASIQVEAPGDEVPGFSLSATGVEPFEDEIDVISLEDGVDEVVSWTPASSGRIQLALRLGWHGAPFTDMLLCETEDVGSLVVPGSLISQFPYFEGGLFQVPSSMGRFDRAVVDTPDGTVELFVGSMQYIGFYHPFPE